jgi:hypothetical protein
MDGTEDADRDDGGVFTPAWGRRSQPGRIVTLGHYYPHGGVGGARTLLREARAGYRTEADPQAVARNMGWTRLINALNAGRRWPLDRLFEMLDPVLRPGIALAAVPPHRAYQAFWPVRELAGRLAAERGRVDATGCLVRVATIRRIVFGGPSTRALHRDTIRAEGAERVRGRRVLLLDDIAKSGASLVACRELLREAGAEAVQALALGRVIVGREED